MIKNLLCFFLFVFLGSTIDVMAITISQRKATNLIQNGDFESGILAPWQLNSKEKKVFSLDKLSNHNSIYAAKVQSDGKKSHLLVSKKILFDMDTKFSMSAWIKTEAISKSDGLSVKILQVNDKTGWKSFYPTPICQLPDDGYSRHPKSGKVFTAGGTQDWTEYKVSFYPDPAAEYIEIIICIDSDVTGIAWLDDIVLSSTTTRIAQTDFTGNWYNLKVWGDQVRFTDKINAVDEMEVNLPFGTYHLWLSMLGENHPNIEVKVDGKTVGTGDGTKSTGWQQLPSVLISDGLHKFSLTCKDPNDFKNKSAYAGMVISTDLSALLPDISKLFTEVDAKGLYSYNSPLSEFQTLFNAPLETLPVTLYPPKLSDKNLVMSVCAHLVDVDFPGTGGIPSEGAARLASIAHKYKIPVTWLVTNVSAVKMKDLLTKWHTEYGDDVATFDFKNLEPLKAALPWASTTVAAVGVGHTRPVDALEKAGMKAAWGWCWDQEGVDNTVDKGCPWAPFYASHNNNNESYKIPANYPGKVLGFEWTMRDLNKAAEIHAGEPCVFSTDPDDVRRGRVVYGRSIEYWKQFLDEYLRNTKWNGLIPFIFQQESHEMEWAFPWTGVYGSNEQKALEANHKTTNLDAKSMDEFFKYAKTKNITYMTLSQLADFYQKKYPSVTPSHYMLFRDIPTQEPISYVTPGAPNHPSPYPLVFHYFDADCQLSFDDSVRLPMRLFNYQLQLPANHKGSYPVEKKIPVIDKFDKEVFEGKEVWKITLSNINKHDVPMGLTEWGDYSRYAVKHFSKNVKEVKIIGASLIFMRFNVPSATTTSITVELEAKVNN